MYSLPNTGIGSLVLTVVALVTAGVGGLLRLVSRKLGR
jgi:LPXTG-motif cell wall-anchored protein